MFVIACAVPPVHIKRQKLRVKDIERAIRQAQSVCHKSEHKASCRVAWDKVEELSSAFARQREQELIERALLEMCEEDPSACKEYDV